MKNFILTVGICILIPGLGLNSCKSKMRAVPESKYTMTKVNEDLVERKWRLNELKGVDLSAAKSRMKIEAFIMFHANENRVNGNSGCNNFIGTYSTDSGAGLHFSQMASTMKMCIDMTVEDQMNKLFQTVDNYSLQGDTLSLKQGKTTLARLVKE